MPLTQSVSAALICGEGAPPSAVRGIAVRVDARQDAALIFAYTLLADLERLRIPLARSARRGEDLWRHTCFEAFLRVPESPAYLELNFSPSGEWAAYQFRRYREGGPIDDDALAPHVSVERAGDRLAVTATVRMDRLPRTQPGTTLRIGTSAVIEAIDGTLSYWALNHPGEKPDFHHADCFALELALAGKSA